MLTIGKLGRSVDQLEYYEQQVAQGIEDYFSARGEAPGRWLGAGCSEIGVAGRVDREGFMRAMAQCDPRSGEWLRQEQSRTKLAAGGVPDGVLREFSRRRAEIEERARELAGVSASNLSRERLQGIALRTRKAKAYGVDGARWREEARARAAEHGLGKVELERLMAATPCAAAVPDADVVHAAAERLSGPCGLTEQHNTFACRHALAEIAGGFTQGASIDELERATSGYLADDAVIALGRLDGEDRFTTQELLACERAIIDGVQRRRDERTGVLDPGSLDRVLAELPGAPNDEQIAAVRMLIADGRGVSVLEALAGTGKTRVLAALARVYDAAGYHVIGVAPTGRAARELADAASIEATTIHRLVSNIEATGTLAPQTVILFDEAGAAPTRPSAIVFAQAQRAGAKVITVGDSGQLASVPAGGWFAAVADRLGGPQLRRVMRQRDPAEREALEALHDGNPDAYVAHKQVQQMLAVHERENDAVEATLADWNAARREYGLPGAVMIARDNATRSILNERARALLVAEGSLPLDAVPIGDQQFRIGDRVIARRNDRDRDVDNGALARVAVIEADTSELTIITDSGRRCLLDAAYATEHLEPAYALTGHGAQGATVEWAGVVGRPSEFGREWAYTSLSRARAGTRVHLIAEATRQQLAREQFAPPQPGRTVDEPFASMRAVLRRSEREALAVEHLEPMTLSGAERTVARPLPLTELSEAGAEHAALNFQPRSPAPARRPEPGWMALRRQRERLVRGRSLGR